MEKAILDSISSEEESKAKKARNELMAAAETLIAYLRQRGNPMDTVIVTKDSAELLSSYTYVSYQ